MMNNPEITWPAVTDAVARLTGRNDIGIKWRVKKWRVRREIPAAWVLKLMEQFPGSTPDDFKALLPHPGTGTHD